MKLSKILDFVIYLCTGFTLIVATILFGLIIGLLTEGILN